MVEVLWRYSNLSDQGERLDDLLRIIPDKAQSTKTRTPTQVQRRLRPDDVTALVAAYETGSTVYELAAQFRIHRSTVSQLLERAGVPRRYNVISDAQLQDLVREYQAGASLATLSAKTGYARTTIRYAMLRAGANLRPRPGWNS